MRITHTYWMPRACSPAFESAPSNSMPRVVGCDDVEAPDRIIVDLEPHEQLNCADVCGAARHLLDRLADLGLSTFAMLSG